MAKVAIVYWDWKEQIPVDRLAEALAHIDEKIHVYEVENTGTDEFAIVIADSHLDPDQVQATWQRSLDESR